MKRILYFIALKIVEVLGIFIIYYLLCWGWVGIDKVSNSQYILSFPFWEGGIYLFVFCVIVFVIGVCLLAWIFANWEKAGKLNE